MRVLILSLLSCLFSSPAWACSCAPWEGYVSEFTEDYVSFWGVFVSAKLSGEETFSGDEIVYEFEVLEDYNQLLAHNIKISSTAPESGNCGISLNLGQVSLWSAHQTKKGGLTVDSCTPNLPYLPLKTYLETREDAYIPARYKCLTKDQKIKENDPQCEVWKAYSNYGYSNEEASDRKEYLKEWRSKKDKVIR